MKHKCGGGGGHDIRMERREVHAGFWWGNVPERDNFRYLGIDRKIIQKYSLNNFFGKLRLN
jgi:hypothetical protein